jgi:energy-coupling factor transporter ATP-binding protein EcfA2
VTLPTPEPGAARPAIVLPEATDLERRVSLAADAVIAQGKTGYNWGSVDTILSRGLAAELGPDGTTRCKQANNSGRAANVLTESNDKDIDLYMVFARAPYSAKKFRRVAVDRIKRFPKLRTVAIAEKDKSGIWRVMSLVERAGVNLAQRIRRHFPLVGDGDIQIVTGAEPQVTVPAEVEGADEELFAAAALAKTVRLDNAASLPDLFRKFASDSGVTLDSSVAVDLLACAMSSQMVLFAGPSGTGKSILARLLARFVTDDDRFRILEARRGWGSPEDAVGYYSSLSDRFAQTSDTALLTDLHEACTAGLLGAPASALVPVLLVEEANLSAIEGYLAPITHGLSAPSVAYIRWPLHAQREGATDTEEAVSLPSTLLLGPWPRVFGTVNVDTNSPAPARKVTARAAVVLLEPDDQFSIDVEVSRLSSSAGDTPTAGGGADWVGDPAAARRSMTVDRLKTMVTGFSSMLMTAGGKKPLVPSRRDVERAANYMANYLALVDWDGTDNADLHMAAENAFLHVVLPQLPADSFADVLQSLSKYELEPASDDETVRGGLLISRVRRLASLTDDVLFSDTIDFWAALS